jgi:hypothetical protein
MSFDYQNARYGTLPTQWALNLAAYKGETIWAHSGRSDNDWKSWLTGIEGVLSRTLLPAYGHAKRGERLKELSLADIALVRNMQGLHRYGYKPLLRSAEPCGDSKFLAWLVQVEDSQFLTHLDLQERTAPAGIPGGYVTFNSGSRYAPVFGKKTFGRQYVRFANALGKAIDAHASDLDLRLKHTFQRPRPFQLALTSPPEVWIATSAQSPSFPSGHALQSMLGAVGLLTQRGFGRLDPSRKDSDSEADLFVRWVAGVGDRRVIAGLHYPSDNLASWIVAVSLVRQCYSGETLDRALVLMTEIILATECWDALVTARARKHVYASALALLRKDLPYLT